jgi:hypothetical protein
VLGVCAVSAGCDGAVIVEGRLDGRSDAEKPCEVSLWNRRAPFWRKPEAQRAGRSFATGNRIRQHWVVSGTVVDHWIEIACPGYQVYRSREFKAPTPQREHDLGTIELTKVGPQPRN